MLLFTTIRADLTMNTGHTVAQSLASSQGIPPVIYEHLIQIVQLGVRPEDVARWYFGLWRMVGPTTRRSDASPSPDVSAIALERRARAVSHPRLSLPEDIPEPPSSSSLDSIIERAMWTTDETSNMLPTSSGYGLFGSPYDSIYRGGYSAERISAQLPSEQTASQAAQQIQLDRPSQSFSQISPQNTSPSTPSLPRGYRHDPNAVTTMPTSLMGWNSYSPDLFSSPDFSKSPKCDDTTASTSMAPGQWYSPGDSISSSTTSQHSLTSTSLGLGTRYGLSPSPHDFSTTCASVGPTSNPTTFPNPGSGTFSALDLPMITIATAKRRRKGRQSQTQQQSQSRQDIKKVVKTTARKGSKP